MQAAIEYVLGADAASASEDRVCQEVRDSYLKDVTVTAADVATALRTLSVDNSRHFAALLVMLGNHVTRTATKARDGAVLLKTLLGLVGTVGLTTAAARAARTEVRALGGALRDAVDGRAADRAAFDNVIGFFKRFIHALVDGDTARVMVLTPLHPLVLETCIRCGRFEVAGAFLAEFTQVVRVEPAATGSTVLDHLAYWYLSGQVHLYLRDLARARASYFVCLTTAAGVASALAVAAAMKHAFCSMLLLETAEHCPSAAPPCVAGVIGDDAHGYFRDIVDAYNKRNIKDYMACLSARDRKLHAAHNLGLAKRVVLAMRMRAVKDMPAVFSRVPLERVRQDAGLKDIAEARRLVADMISTGILAASLVPAVGAAAAARAAGSAAAGGGTVSGDDAAGAEIVEFSATGDAGGPAGEARLRATMARYAVAVREIEEFQGILEDFRVDVSVPVRVATALQEQKQQRGSGGGGAGGGGNEGGGGASIEERNVQAALAASVFDS